MAYAIEVIRFNLIFNFFLFFVLIVIFFLAYKTENDFNSIFYSRNPDNLWCYPDVHCQNLKDETGDFSLAFQFNKIFNDINTDQNITFQSYDTNNGISSQVFNIYWNEDLPSGAVQQKGVCAGYLNYSESGTSIYLKYYNNSTSWISGIDNGAVGNIFSNAYTGTSSYILNQATLTSKENTMTYQLAIPGPTGLSVSVTNLNNSALDSKNNSIIGFKGAPLYAPVQINDNPNKSLTNPVMTSYINSIKSDIKSRTVAGTSIIRCIDPSFVSEITCDIVNYQPTQGGYCLNSKKRPLASKDNCTKFCTTSQISHYGNLIKAMINTNCMVPFCTNSGANSSSNNRYKTNNFSIANTSKQDDTLNQYKINGVPLNEITTQYGGAGGDKSATFNGQVQAQHLLFCGGTSTATNNITDTDLSTSAGKCPLVTPSFNATTPYMATQPNAKKDNGKVILGFK